MERKSGIELLKIFTIFIIVVGHIVQTLTEVNGYAPYSDFIIDISHSSTDLTNIILLFLSYLGPFGNLIFFICSAWFLLDKNVSYKKKVLYMIVDVWIISMLFFIPIIIARGGDVSPSLIFKSLFPTFRANNWYITCYILFCLLYPFLNLIINSLSQKGLLRVAVFMGIVYLVLDFLRPFMFSCEIITWIAVYFIIAYIKNYHIKLADSKKFNVIIIAIGLLGNAALVLATNFLGLKIGFLSDKAPYWSNNCSPFIFLADFGIFNLFRMMNFKSKFVNGTSKLAMLIYLIHENILLKTYYRTQLWHEIYVHFGYDYVLLWVLALSVGFFVASALLSWVYSKTIQVLTHKLCDKICDKIKGTRLYKKFSDDADATKQDPVKEQQTQN